jgi:hypothetical protein
MQFFAITARARATTMAMPAILICLVGFGHFREKDIRFWCDGRLRF